MKRILGVLALTALFGCAGRMHASSDWELLGSRRVSDRIDHDLIGGKAHLQQPGEITFPIIQHLVEDVLLVSEEEIYAAMRYSLTRLKIVAEPSGVVCIAAALAGKVPAGIKRVGIVVSGGNIDLDLIATLA